MSQPGSTVAALSRRELYDLVWSKPMSKLAPTYGLSDVGLTKICRKMQVPTPPVGYWQKLRNGQSVRRTRLPELSDEDEQGLRVELTKQKETDVRPLTEADRLVLAEKSSDKSITVPANIEPFHPLVEKTDRSIRAAKLDPNGLANPRAKGCLAVSVGPASIDRAMRILDALIRAFETRGFSVTVSDGESRVTHVEILGEKLSIRLEELLDRKERELTAAQKRERELYSWLADRRPEYDYFPSGRLALQIDVSTNRGTRSQWSDGKARQLEALLNAFIAGLIRAADDVREQRRENEERQRRWKEEEEQRKQEELRRIQEEVRAHQLQTAATNWQTAELLRRYVGAVRQEVIKRLGAVANDSEVGRWLQWAEGHIAAIDPLTDMKPLPAYSISQQQCDRWRWQADAQNRTGLW